jgi:hypothetical protein
MEIQWQLLASYWAAIQGSVPPGRPVTLRNLSHMHFGGAKAETRDMGSVHPCFLLSTSSGYVALWPDHSLTQNGNSLEEVRAFLL